jgi:hypothetical protein
MTISVAVLINSCEKFWNTTMDVIIPSAKKANIPGRDIFIIVGECDEERDIEYNEEGGFNIVYCRYVNEAYNTAIYFTQHPKGRDIISQYSHLFYTQDTSSFMEHFWDKINLYAPQCDSYIKLQYQCAKTIGLFNVQWLLDNKTDLLSYYVNYDKSLILKYKDGDFPNKELIYTKFNNLPQWLNEDALFMFDGNGGYPIGHYFINPDIKTYVKTIYNGGGLRKASIFVEPGIIKYQKNWGQYGPDAGWDLTL